MVTENLATNYQNNAFNERIEMRTKEALKIISEVEKAGELSPG